MVKNDNDDDNSDSFERNSPSTPDLDIRSDPESAIRFTARSILIDRVRVTRTKGVKNDPTLLRYFIAILCTLWKTAMITRELDRDCTKNENYLLGFCNDEAENDNLVVW